MDATHFFHNPLPFASVFAIQCYCSSRCVVIYQWFIIQHGKIESLELLDSHCLDGVQYRDFTTGLLTWNAFEAEFCDYKTNTKISLQRDSV